MALIFAAVGVATAGLVVLAVLSVRVWVAARGLGREVERTRRLLAERRERAARVTGRADGAAQGRSHRGEG
jgi:hypothetical protein